MCALFLVCCLGVWLCLFVVDRACVVCVYCIAFSCWFGLLLLCLFNIVCMLVLCVMLLCVFVVV